MPDTISADQVIGKTLYAKIKVDVKKLPYDDQATLYSVVAGQPIGVVYSWVEPTTGRKNLWWQIQQPGGTYVWVEHYPGRFDVNKLQDQGVVTEQQAAWDNKTIFQKAMTIGAYLLGGYMVVSLAQRNERKRLEAERAW